MSSYKLAKAKMNSSSLPCALTRVLVADCQWEQRTVIEKTLGMLGYFRVCPAASFNELAILMHYSSNVPDRFDLLILNADLVLMAGRSVWDVCAISSCPSMSSFMDCRLGKREAAV